WVGVAVAPEIALLHRDEPVHLDVEDALTGVEHGALPPPGQRVRVVGLLLLRGLGGGGRVLLRRAALRGVLGGRLRRGGCGRRHGGGRGRGGRCVRGGLAGGGVRLRTGVPAGGRGAQDQQGQDELEAVLGGGLHRVPFLRGMAVPRFFRLS